MAQNLIKTTSLQNRFQPMKKTLWIVSASLLLMLTGANAQPAIQTLVTNGLFEPYGIAVGPENNYYVADSASNQIIKYATLTGEITVLAGGGFSQPGSSDNPIGILARFFQPQGIVYDATRNGLVVADSGNNLIRLVSLQGGTTTLAGTGATGGNNNADPRQASFNFPTGLAADNNGNIYIADLKGNAIRRIDPAGAVTTLVDSGLNLPSALSLKLDGAGNAEEIFVADTGNHAIKSIVLSDPGTVAEVQLIAGSGDRFVFGNRNSLVATDATFNQPRGLVYVPSSGDILVSDTGNSLIRRVFFNPIINALSVSTYVSDPEVLASPHGIVMDAIGNFPFVDLVNSSLNLIQLATPRPPIDDPEIGVVTFDEKDALGVSITTLETFTKGDTIFFTNEPIIAILPSETNVQTFYTFDPNADFAESSKDWEPAPAYRDGLSDFPQSQSIVNDKNIAVFGPKLTIKAISTGPNRRPSQTVSATLKFEVAGINFLDGINGDVIAVETGDDGERSRNLNPLSIVMSTETVGAQIWYSTDGNNPSPGAPNSTRYLPESSISLVEAVFKAPGQRLELIVMGFKDGYEPSRVLEIVELEDLVASQVGFTPKFTAGIGSTIIVPLEVRLEPGNELRSFQTRVEVKSMPRKDDTGNDTGDLAPLVSDQFRTLNWSTNEFITFDIPIEAGEERIPLINNIEPTYTRRTTGGAADDIRGLSFGYFGDSNFLATEDSIIGLMAIPIPPNAQEGDRYALYVKFPSGTSDGLTSPVLITPLNDEETNPAIITVGNIEYFVGDTAEARWYNAGDFGNNNLNNNDVLNAFFASTGLRVPYSFTDVFDAMDAFPVDFPPFAGGDGQIRSLDWNVILQRSLRRDGNVDPNLNDDDDITFTRSWSTGGSREASTGSLIRIPNRPAHEEMVQDPSIVWDRQARLEAENIGNALPGTTVSVPIRLKVKEDHSVSGLQFRAEVLPEHGAPALTEPTRFVPDSNLPLSQPFIFNGLDVIGLALNQTMSAWALPILNTLSGLQDDELLGHITFKIPDGAPANSSYTVRFINVDGSPDFETQYDLESVSGKVVVGADAPNQPRVFSDEWKQTFFGGLENMFTTADADPDGDGLTNLEEYQAGKHPSELRVQMIESAQQGAQQDDGFKLRWFTRPDRSYSVQRSHDLNAWSKIGKDVRGSGTISEINDPVDTSKSVFYRIVEKP